LLNKPQLEHKLDPRASELYRWIKAQISLVLTDFQMISGDASFRRYFRITYNHGSLIAVDAPPKYENIPAFVAVAKGLKRSGLIVPEIVATDFEQGFMLLSDLGDEQLLNQLNPSNVDIWYQQALQDLVKLQKTQDFKDFSLPQYDRVLLMQEMNLMPQWFLQQYLSMEISTAEQKQLVKLFDRLCELALSQPQVTTHLDYHSRNLMVLPQQKLAIIDFQDAVLGAVSYDLISLIKDCYIKWPVQKVDGWMRDYHQMLIQAEVENLPEIDEFIFLADAMGLQRHIKVLGIFARLYQRDGKPQFLEDLPLTLEYIVETCERYAEFNQFGDWMKQKIMPKFNHKQQSLKEQL
jgi:hypothetical protein